MIKLPSKYYGSYREYIADHQEISVITSIELLKEWGYISLNATQWLKMLLGIGELKANRENVQDQVILYKEIKE